MRIALQLPHKLAITGAVVSLFGVIFGWAFFPWFINGQIAKNKGLTPGSEIRQIWEKFPFALDFKIHIFNVTNHMAVQQGEIPMVHEIGPFIFDEWKEKAEIIDNETDDTVTFHMKSTWVFNKERSAPFTGDEVVIVPHPVLLGMVGAVERERPIVLGLINKALPFLFNDPETIFLKTTVNDLLFGGNIINCTSKNFAVTAVCTFIEKESDSFQVVEPNIYKFSILGMKNGTADKNLFKVSRGMLDYRTVGEMVSLNGKEKLDTWQGDPCNELTGTDSTIFPPFTNPEEDIFSFAVDICRSFGAKFQRPSSYKGIDTLRYTAGFGDMSTVPEDKCFCWNDTTCMKKGVMDIMKCIGSPAIASLPHFYDAHEDYLKGVRGLHPDESKHSIVIDIEPLTGSPLYAKNRLQFALPLHQINKIDLTTNLPTTILPFLWFEEGIELNDEFVSKLDGQLFRIIRIVDIIKWLLTAVGAAFIAAGIALHFKRQKNLSISPTVTARRNIDIHSDFLGEKKPHNGQNDGGHTNLGFAQNKSK